MSLRASSVPTGSAARADALVPGDLEQSAYASMDPDLQLRLRTRFATMLADSKLSIPRRQYKQKAQQLFSAFKESMVARRGMKTYQQVRAEAAEAVAQADVTR